ncbi:DUF362 domain-containing protein [Candidatus Poribacteria bacterium]|nr:DUF362 domain-containing protein [Candidatus Poribacteria bacterium]
MKAIVSIVRYEDISSVAKAIDLCDGFKNLKATCRVLLKPNVVTAGRGFIPPFGTVTTTKVIEGTIRALKDFGVSDISIGEGTVLDELGANTMKAFKWIQVDRLAKRYGIKLIDFNGGPHKKIQSEDVPINIAEAALDTDFFINLPVLKTHSDTRVSLSGKNLKGCMSMASKKYFHGPDETLHYRISRLMEMVPQHLVIIDGIYVMDKGPDATVGTAYPRGVLVASTDFLAADATGVRLLGGEPTEAEHIRLYAERHGRMNIMKQPEAIEIRGERVEDHAKFLPWKVKPGFDLLASGHTGIEIRVNTSTMCSGCDANLKGPTMLLAALCRNKNFHGLRIIAGKNLRDEQNSPRTILFGNCPIKENKHLDKAKRLEGCPPKFWDSLFFMANQIPGFGARIAFYSRLAAYLSRAGMGIGILPLPRYEIYRKKPDYNIGHFEA